MKKHKTSRQEAFYTRGQSGGTRSIVVLSILGLVIAIGAAAVAVNAELYSLQTRSVVSEIVNALKRLDEEQKNLSQAVEGAKLSAAASEEKYAALAENTMTAGNQTASGTSETVPSLDQAFPSGTVPMANGSAVDTNELFAIAPSLILQSPSGDKALGKAAMAVYQGWTFYKLAAIDLPALSDGDFYSVWLENPDNGDVIFAGQMEYEASTSQAVLIYSESRDLSAYRKTTVYLDHSGQVENGPVVLSGEFPADTVFTISPEDVMNLRDTGNTPASGAGSTAVPQQAQLPSAPQQTGSNSQVASGDSLANLLGGADPQLLQALLGSGDSTGAAASGQAGSGQSGLDLAALLGGDAGQSQLLQALLGNQAKQ